MKKNKSTKRIRSLVLLFTIVIFMYNGKTFATITGPQTVLPGVTSNYSWGFVSGGVNPVWSSNNVNVSFSPTNGNSTTISINKNITVCSVELKVTYDYIDTGGMIYGLTETKTIYIDPFLTGPNTVYPGESITITNRDNCSGGAGHTACYWNWSCSDMSALSCGGSCTGNPLNTANINCPSTLPAGVSSSGIYNITCNKYCGSGSYQYQSMLPVNVALHNISIYGPSGVGCGGGATSGLVYTASSVTGANYYVWSVPSGWNITAGNNTSAITVSTNGSNAGYVTVRAYASAGSAVKSNVTSRTVGCCATNLSISTNVGSGNAEGKEADNSITATNTISNNAFAVYHAGSTIYLNPGFYAAQGSYMHAYIEGCTGDFYRMKNPSDTLLLTEELAENQLENIEQISNNDLKHNELNVYPNPTKGEFKLIFDHNTELPISIRLTDVFGKEIKSFQDIKEYEYNFNLSEYSDGIYFINTIYTDKTVSKKVIKN
jgi:hypothetical protein